LIVDYMLVVYHPAAYIAIIYGDSMD